MTESVTRVFISALAGGSYDHNKSLQTSAGTDATYWAARAAYAGTLGAARRALNSGPKGAVVVHLTPVGLGAFGNDGEVVADALNDALRDHLNALSKDDQSRIKVVLEVYAAENKSDANEATFLSGVATPQAPAPLGEGRLLGVGTGRRTGGGAERS